MNKRAFLETLYKITKAFNSLEVQTDYVVRGGEGINKGVHDVKMLNGKSHVAHPIEPEDERVWLSFKKNGEIMVGYNPSYQFNPYRQVTFRPSKPEKAMYNEGVATGHYGSAKRKTHISIVWDTFKIDGINYKELKKAIELNGGNNYYIDSSLFKECKTPEEYADFVLKENAIVKKENLNMGIKTSLQSSEEVEFVWKENENE